MIKIRKANKLLFVVLSLVLVKLVASTDNRCLTNKGRQFIFGFMPNLSEKPVILRLSITTQLEKDVSVTITTPLFDPSFQTSIYVRRGDVKEITLSSVLQVSSGNENKGVFVEADGEVSVYASNTRHASMDDFLVLPIVVLGNEYYVTSWSDKKPFFMIVATDDFTKLTITLGPSSRPVSLMGRTVGNGDEISVNMRKFETFYVQTLYGDFTGTHIYGNTSFAVFGGNVCANVGSGWCDHLAQQMLPLHRWEKEFVTLSMPGCASGDWFKIVAGYENTTVNISGMPAKTLVQSGNFFAFNLQDSSIREILSDKPISIFMFSQGNCGTNYSGDPSMILVPAVSQYSSNVTFSTISPGKSYFENNVGIVVQNDYKYGLRLDGLILPSVHWFSVDGLQTFVYTEFTVSADVHSIYHLSSSVKFLAFSSGIHKDVCHSYLLGLDFDNETCTDNGIGND